MERKELDLLIIRYRVRLLNYANSLVRNYQKAKDIFHDAVYEIIKSYNQGLFDGREFIAWSFAIIRNIVHSHISKEYNAKIRNYKYCHAANNTITIDLRSIDMPIIIDRIFSILKNERPVVKKIYMMRVVDNLSFDEITSNVNMKRSSVSMAFYRANEIVKSKLTKQLL